MKRVALITHLGFPIDPRMVLQQELRHLHVTVVTGHVQWSVTHLQKVNAKATQSQTTSTIIKKGDT